MSTSYNLDGIRVQTARMLEIYSLLRSELEGSGMIDMPLSARSMLQQAVDTIADNMAQLAAHLAAMMETPSAVHEDGSVDYPGIGPEHAYLKEVGRAQYEIATDDEALEAFQILSQNEGIIPALESSHAIAHAMKVAKKMPKDAIILVNLSGRGDKDVDEVRRILASRESEKH